MNFVRPLVPFPLHGQPSLHLKTHGEPRLVWLSGLSSFLWTKGLLVWFPVRAHAWVASQVPSWGCMTGNHTLMFLSLPSPLSKNEWTKSFVKSNKVSFFEKKSWWVSHRILETPSEELSLLCDYGLINHGITFPSDHQVHQHFFLQSPPLSYSSMCHLAKNWDRVHLMHFLLWKTTLLCSLFSNVWKHFSNIF